MEEEGEGFCEQQKWNQEIGPKVLNFHPRSLNCPECTLLPKVILLFFVFTDTAREYRWAPVKQSSRWPVMYGQPYSVSWISVVLTHNTMWRVTFAHFCWCCGEKLNNWSLRWNCGLNLCCIFFAKFPCPGIHLFLKFQIANKHHVITNEYWHLSIKFYWKAIALSFSFVQTSMAFQNQVWKLMWDTYKDVSAVFITTLLLPDQGQTATWSSFIGLLWLSWSFLFFPLSV